MSSRIYSLKHLFVPLALIGLGWIWTPALHAEESGVRIDKWQQFELKLGLGCVSGFGAWIAPPLPADEERQCDIDNLFQFSKALGSSGPKKGRTNREIPPLAFDSNHDSRVTCDDYYQWKQRLQKQFESGDRSTDGSALRATGCDKSLEEAAAERAREIELWRALPFQSKIDPRTPALREKLIGAFISPERNSLM